MRLAIRMAGVLGLWLLCAAAFAQRVEGDRAGAQGLYDAEITVTNQGEAQRNDDDYLYVAAWEHKGEGSEPVLHKEPLVYEEVKLATRSYK